MRKYETLDLELDDETLEKLTSEADKLNMTLDRFVELVVENYLSKRVTKEELIEILNSDASCFKKFFIIVDKDGKAIAKVTPYED